MLFIKKILNKIKSLYLDIYFIFNDKILFKDKYGLSYYLYKNTRPKDTYKIGVRTDDTTVLYTIEKILKSSISDNNKVINCFDVGSYIGVITLMMSKSLQKNKKKWRIHSFEPSKESYLRLKKNIELDPFATNIKLNNVGVLDKDGIQILKTNLKNPGQNNLISNVIQNNEDVINEEIRVINLRDYMNQNEINSISICKVDTEGTDNLVIKGLYQHLKNNTVDYFILEYEELSFENLKNLLTTNGYSIYYMVRNENILVSSLSNYPKHSKSLLNLIAVSPYRMKDFKLLFKLDQINII